MSYNTFAGFYDELTDNISYPARAAYFDSVIRRFCPQASILLDLACGTGSLSIELARLGYDVVGTDASEQMLSEAMQKKAQVLYGEDFEREEPSDPQVEKLLFLCQPMQELDMYGTIDAAVCALDSINHITDRRGEDFPLQCQNRQYTHLLNPRPLFLSDRLPEWDFCDFLTLRFTTETPAECDEVLKMYQTGAAPAGSFTRGLYYRTLK